VQRTVIGAGAIGGTINAHLIRDGHDVLLCDADPGHVDAINRAGLSIEGQVENFTVTARAVTPDGLPGSLGRVAIARPRWTGSLPGCAARSPPGSPS
jgi:ketopantoate reductase